MGEEYISTQSIEKCSYVEKNTSFCDSVDNTLTVDVDTVLSKGGFGRFQTFTFVLVTSILITFGYQAVLSYFVVNDPSWRCTQNNSSNFCRKYSSVAVSSDSELYSQRCHLNRSEWEFVVDKKYSIVTEYDLVCKNTAVYALISSVYHVGGSIGIFISGLAADRYGRKYVLMIFLTILTISSIGCSFINSLWQLIILRAFLGAGEVSAYSISYVYLSEIVPPDYRAITGIGYGVGYVISEFMINGLAYILRQWRTLQLYASLPCVIGIILLFFVPKSPRWLMVNNNKKEAETILKKITAFNKLPLPPFKLKSDEIVNTESYTYWHLFKSGKIAILTLLISFLWLTAAMAYYTIAFESSNIGGDMYQSFAFTTLGEIPSKFVAYFILNRFGRKKSTLTALVLTGGFAASTRLVPKCSAKYIIDIVLMAFGRLFADVNIMGLYLWTFELYPTVVRLQGVGVCMIFEKVGSFAAPFLTSVLHQVNASLPYLIVLLFTVVSSGCSCFILPETYGKPTREKYEDFFEENCYNGENESVKKEEQDV